MRLRTLAASNASAGQATGKEAGQAAGQVGGEAAAEAAGRLAGEELVAACREVLREREHVRLAIPGGSALEASVGARRALGADWARVLLTWVDERCVPVSDEASNRGAARGLGLLEAETDAVDRPAPARVLPLFEDGESPADAVARVERGLEDLFAGELDVLLLGMGEDGHVASLFPSRPEPRGRGAAHVAQSPKPPSDRITLTRPLLQTARRSVLLATGEAKREALERLLRADPTLPAHGMPGLIVVTDLDLESAETHQTDHGPGQDPRGGGIG